MISTESPPEAVRRRTGEEVDRETRRARELAARNAMNPFPRRRHKFRPRQMHWFAEQAGKA